MAKQISLSEIRIDGGTQMRQQIETTAVDDYAAAFAAGIDMPAVKVFHDGATNWLADGFHRWHAARKAGLDKIKCDVEQGTQRDAILYAVGANRANGMRRTNADKRVCVMKLLHDPEWVKRSNGWIAEKCGVDQSTVSDYRKQVVPVKDSLTDEKRIGRNGVAQSAKSRRKPKKKPDLHVPPIDEEVEAPKLEVTPRPPLTKKQKSFDAEKSLVRALADLSSLIKRTHYDADIDKGRIAHELNELANEVAEAIEEAEAA